MSWKATAAVSELTTGITRSEKLLLYVIADRHNKDHGKCWLSMARMAKEALMSESTVRRCLKRLREKRLVDYEDDKNAGRGHTHEVTLPWLEKGAILTPFSCDGKGVISEPENVEKVSNRPVKGVIAMTPEQEEQEKKEPQLVKSAHSPCGGASLSFKTFRVSYPSHRMTRKHDRAAVDEWDRLSAEDQRAACAGLDEAIYSPEWLQDDGKWVPAPERFLRERRWETVKHNHHGEVEEIHGRFVRSFELPPNLNSLTPDRRRMLSERYDDAIRIGIANDVEPMSIINTAMEACLNSERRSRDGPARLETIFATTERFEHWIEKSLRE